MRLPRHAISTLTPSMWSPICWEKIFFEKGKKSNNFGAFEEKCFKKKKRGGGGWWKKMNREKRTRSRGATVAHRSFGSDSGRASRECEVRRCGRTPHGSTLRNQRGGFERNTQKRRGNSLNPRVGIFGVGFLFVFVFFFTPFARPRSDYWSANPVTLGL